MCGWWRGFPVDDGGMKTAGLDSGIRLVPKVSSESGHETRVSTPVRFPCRSLEQWA